MTNRQVKDITPKAWAREQREKQALDQNSVQITAANVLS